MSRDAAWNDEIAEEETGPANPYCSDPDLTAVEAADLWAQEIAEDAGPGWKVERCQRPPYGWDLRTPDGDVADSGPLERLEGWVHRRAARTPPSKT
ncbi:hypothetical protein [Nocardia acidivorans]|uniref:hypothetical protein n=1 Tax=Nocardia acidivorans TaxID=404580 RepID=UPI0008369E95|nr:hypothetical protein [Nocardia acidivorans]